MQVSVISTAETVLFTIRPPRDPPARTGAGAPADAPAGGCAGGSGGTLITLPGDG
ncbi:hypothetical protein Sxan_32620 [Streptomyces xanthophaeus]|uniref:Uncharacterized protein n=1 Tax=Streptomyces xanthophaeus TaxID=67385 RepID=A0A919H396_9ACTN|nr:hypothetical protein Sxan_32620 [Streptomyces xanthophaeus]